ncbi:MAG: prephenate dehydratase [Lentisphaerae bacterium RIFOXYB12_FULL_65_16]|nr:MAG: prephenate dehydratase [Lentisphaerae bacterium RIFOXYA12_64_32]OGV89773.1 MAG: prephenate dehydratase [Lentisphaerae bacterium RIFOXYB12_FULL_65_16]
MDAGEIQSKINAADDQILALLNERTALIKRLGKCRKDESGDLLDPEYESRLLARLSALNKGPVRNETLRAVFREIISGAMVVDAPLIVAFLGPATTFTHQAARTRFGGSAQYVPQPSITDVFEAVDHDQANYGVVPVENSTEGAVTHTLDMFVDSNVKVCAEINMAIHHNLLSHCRTKEEIKVIYSHPQVFGQCRHWLQRHLPTIPLVEVSSTTEAASRCANEPAAAALASALAADRYNLDVLAQNTEDFSDNLTRFLVLSRQDGKPTGDDKTSMFFVLRDRVGALYESLRPFYAHKINLTFIESRPSRRKRWEYYFFVDFLGHVSEKRVQEVLAELGEHCQFVKIVGSYPRAASTA